MEPTGSPDRVAGKGPPGVGAFEHGRRPDRRWPVRDCAGLAFGHTFRGTLVV